MASLYRFQQKWEVISLAILSAWSSENGLVLGQEKTAEKSNEITAIPQLLDVLELKGCIVTIDAMGCQTAIAEKIIQKKADYVLALKGNQGKLHVEVTDFFEIALAENFKQIEHDYYEEHEYEQKRHLKILQSCAILH